MLAHRTDTQPDSDSLTSHASVILDSLSNPFFAAFDASPIAQILLCADKSFTIMAVSNGYLRLTQSRREDLLGHSVSTVFSELPDSSSLHASLQRVVATRIPDSLSSHRFSFSHTPVFDSDQSVAWILQSLNELPAKLDNNSFLVALDDSIRPLTDPDAIVANAVRRLSEQLDVDRCTYRTYDAEKKQINIASEYARPGVRSLIGRYPITHFGTEFARHMLSNRPFVVDDVEADPLVADGRQAYRETGIRSVIAIPLHKAGTLVAAMGVTQHQHPRKWLPEEVALVSAVAYRCWESVERARVTQELHASEQRLRLSHRAARIGSFEWLMKEDHIIWMPELEDLYGIPEGSFEGHFENWKQRVVPQDAAQVVELIEQAIARKQNECSYEFRAVLPDGNLRWLRGRSKFFYNEAGEAERMVGVNIDISAQKKIQADLNESASRLRAIFDGTYEYIGLLTPQGTVLEANRASLEFAGNRLSEVQGKLFWEIPWFSGTPGMSQVIQDGVIKASKGEFVRLEATVRPPSGEPRTFDISLYPVCDHHGQVTLIVPEGRDITERKLAEERLNQQWITFDTALSNSPDLTYTFDLQGRFSYANRELCRISQRSLQNTVGKTPEQLGYPSDLAQRIHRQIQQVIETRQTLRDQTAFRLPTGEVREYEYIYAPVIGESGKVEAVTGATRDVTVRKEAEEQLRKSEMQFRQLFDSLPQLVWSSLPDGHDDLYNKQWFEYTGLTYSDVSGDGSAIIHPDDLPLALERWTHSLKTGTPYETEYRLRRSDGQYRWFLGRANPVLDELGKVVRWFGTCTDIHEKKESETALQNAHRQLEEFSYVASHDLQEPLRMVNIYSQLILRRIDSSDSAIAQYADFVRQGVKRMETLISDLLTFSRTSQADLHPADNASLTDALKEALSVLASRIEENDAVIRSSTLPVVKGHTPHLAHIFQNVISNALKYRKPDQPPQIQISATPVDNHWVISIADNGIGFEQKYAERIFGLFKRLHRDEYPGTGLGLAICQRIVERYGGRMWADGRPGEGAIFYFSLPAARLEDTQIRSEAHKV